MTISLTVLGTSGMYATVERAASGYLLDVDGTKICVDMGAGTWRNLLAEISYGEIAGILLSHCHPDHVTDVFQAYHARRYGQPDPMPKIPLWAPAETLERVLGFLPEMVEAFDLRTIKAGATMDLAGSSLSFIDMAHPAETVGMRFEQDGKVLAYSADSGEAADFEALASGADVFLCEATLQEADEPWEGHLSGAQAGRIGAAAGVGKMVLTHLPPGRDHEVTLSEARGAASDLKLELAADGMHIDVV
ncbi:MAG TPA: MBL fold metallo-hydrolase [Actinomycetota bacterium]|nr:MBL fold metallo-hydrolase [Actinomycetota bacterium]